MYTARVEVPQAPKVVFFARLPQRTEDGRYFEEVTRRVASLQVVPVEEGGDEHWLRRLDRDGALVWQTSHPSLEETFWQAEWEYGTVEKAWQNQ